MNDQAAPWTARMLLLACGLLAACSDGVGNGTKPVRFYLGVDTESTSTSMSECTSQALNAYLVFSDGEGSETIGNYNDRASWVSDNPSVVLVSDGLSPSPDGTVYAAGTVVGLRPGVATIKATYLDFNASITVDVLELAQLRIDSALTDIGSELDQQFVLKAVLKENTPEQEITTYADWRFDPDTAHANVDSATALVHANSPSSAPLRLVARLRECDREVQTTFRVSPVTSLRIDYELGEQTLLPVGYSDSLTVSAGFDDPAAPRQNVTTQMTLDHIDDDELAAVLGDETYTVTAQDRSGNGALRLKLDPLGLTVQSKTWQVQSLDLVDLVLTPPELEVVYPLTGQLAVTGIFANGLQMPITRHVTWSSSSAVASVGSGADDAGEVTVTDTDADADISASVTTDYEVLTDSSVVHVYSSQGASP